MKDRTEEGATLVATAPRRAILAAIPYVLTYRKLTS